MITQSLPQADTETSVSPLAVVHPNVRLGRGVKIEEFCIIGYPPKGSEPGELETVIGDGTHIRSHTTIYAGVQMGEDCHVSHGAFIREHTTFGRKCSVGINAVIEHHCQIGDNVRLQGQAGVSEYCIIEDDVWVGPRVVLTNTPHPTCERAKECLTGALLRKGCIIGANVVICPGIEIGERAFIGAGALVAKNVDPEAVVVGIPGKKLAVVEDMKCNVDLVDGSPYERRLVELTTEIDSKAPQRTVPLVDLKKQHLDLKLDLRLAVDRVVFNSRFINGKEVGEFEQAFAKFSKASHCVGTSSGTDALMLALHSMGVGRGDEVITVSHTFIATAEAILALGAVPVFVDIDEQTFNMDASLVEQAITEKTKAIVPVYLYGRPAAMDQLRELADRHKLAIVADAAQAQGANYQDQPIAHWADATTFSFFPGKNLGAFGDAGGVITNDKSIADRIARLRDHGREKKYVHSEIGWNSRLDTLQASVLLAKLPHLAKWNDARSRIADDYRSGLQTVQDLILPDDPGEGQHVYHQFVVRHPQRDELHKWLQKHGVAAGIHYPIPVHLQPAFKDLGPVPTLPVTERVVEDIISLPMYPEMDDESVQYVVDTIRAFQP